MFTVIPEWLRELNIVTIAIRIVMALLIGGFIGEERERKNQPAGFRTYMLVCLGAALVMMTNQYIIESFGGGDPSRLGAQVVSGIGFLGAGSIIVTRKNQVRGLTTAAGLWTAACAGLAIGIGFYEGAVIAGLTIMIIMTLFRKIDKVLVAKSPILRIYISFSSIKAVTELIKICREREYKIVDMQVSKGKTEDAGLVAVIIVLSFEKPVNHADVINEFAVIEETVMIEEI